MSSKTAKKERKINMIKFKQQYVLDRKGNYILLNNGNEEYPLRFIELLSLIARNYRPSEQHQLSIGDIRLLNKAIDVLDEKEYEIDDELEMTNDSFHILKDTVLNVLPSFIIPAIIQNAPEIEDMINAIE